MADGGQLGVTPPISTALPTEAEKRCNDALQKELKAQNTYELASDTIKRGQVLESLQTIADAFVEKVAKIKEPEQTVLHQGARGQIFTYGSYRLGVYGPGSDIDTLVVAPKYVNRQDFFDYFPDLLLSMAPAGAITDLTAVTDAFVPIIKFEYSDISIDLIFSSVDMTQLKKEEFTLQDNNILRGLDDAALRSLNGTRVTDQILQLVPEQTSFRLALRAIKLWAQRRAIYANIMGYPGGVAWAMLVARIAQLYPKANGATLVNKFFQIMKRWPWPKPVLLKVIEEGNLQVRVWNPVKYKGDSFHLMPIITPAYPSMCATYNITSSGKAVIQRELDRFAAVTDGILAGVKPWSELFVKHTFFTKDYKYYIMVTATGLTKDAASHWSGFIESKVRLLVGALERHESIALARPFNKGYERVHKCKNGTNHSDKVIDGSLDFVTEKDAADEALKAEEKTTDGKEGEAANGTKVQPEYSYIYTTTFYIGLELYEGAKSLDLSNQVGEFKQTCHLWEKWQSELRETAFLSINHLRDWALPSDVFELGEIKPARTLKKRPAAPNGAGPNKRVASEDHAMEPKRRKAPTATAAAAS